MNQSEVSGLIAGCIEPFRTLGAIDVVQGIGWYFRSTAPQHVELMIRAHRGRHIGATTLFKSTG